ncbi:protein crumbs homolog 1-like [Argiope bruennichi]|uniref:protein crumbs homolog 1-like n=1 Tax=Argiope bruennichi TaxID=94029 RepID=UPI0024953277|nr:protein crumbs homolog 1-like [Argiope bruennichi]
MSRILTFSVTLVFCLVMCVVTAKETRKNDVLLSEPESNYSISMDKSINKEFHINVSELEADRADECKCKNGRCMRVCDFEKTVPCLERKKVCVCSPGFSEKDGVCVDCNCGQGFNCTFKKDGRGSRRKICFCPKGYTFFQFDSSDSYDDYCKPECSDERPCQNGGICSDGKCTCSWGTMGDLCEKIYLCRSMCENKLELNCLYHLSEKIPYCTCKNSSLYYDPEENYCKPCPCGKGDCEYSFDYNEQHLKCKCQPNYKEFRGYCKRCDCGFGFPCEFDSKGNKICNCEDGFYEREGRCIMCDCTPYGTDTKCKIIDNVKRCYCKEGFHDVLGQCEDVDECEIYDPCHPSATCYNKYGSFECRCPDGYEGLSGKIVKPGEVCKDINECQQTPNPCWLYNNVKCVDLPGSFKCECFEGYEPSGYNREPQRTSCVRTTKAWGPPLIVLFTSIALIVISCLVHVHVKKRAARLN